MIERDEGRCLFGNDPEAYDRSRPPYPTRVFDLLVERVGLGQGCRILEIGAGTGTATAELLARGAGSIVAVEPDARLAARLRERAGPASAVTVIEDSFENAELEPGTFDLAVSATAFHWIEEAMGLARARRALRPGGGLALWWHVFGDPDRPDPFHEATTERLAPLGQSPSAVRGRQSHHALDRRAREKALVDAGFSQVTSEVVRGEHRFSAARLRDLYATFSPIARLPAGSREEALQFIEATARDQFGGFVTRPLLTAVYCARSAG